MLADGAGMLRLLARSSRYDSIALQLVGSSRGTSSVFGPSRRPDRCHHAAHAEPDYERHGRHAGLERRVAQDTPQVERGEVDAARQSRSQQRDQGGAEHGSEYHSCPSVHRTGQSRRG